MKYTAEIKVNGRSRFISSSEPLTQDKLELHKKLLELEDGESEITEEIQKLETKLFYSPY